MSKLSDPQHMCQVIPDPEGGNLSNQPLSSSYVKLKLTIPEKVK